MKLHWITKADQLPDTLIIPLAGGDALEGALQDLANTYELPADSLRHDVKAKKNEIHLLYGRGGKRLFLLGLGESPDFATAQLAFRTLSHQRREQLSPRIGLGLAGRGHAMDTAELLDAACNGLALGAYGIGFLKQEEPAAHPLDEEEAELCILTPKPATDDMKGRAFRGLTLAATQRRIFDLVNAPSNHKTPEDLAGWARKAGQAFGFTVRVIEGQELLDLGLHALLAVNRGSEFPAAFIIMEYQPDGLEEAAPRVGLVGKGVTFDTGGLSIKPSQNMHLMKSDMGGAAAVFGAMEATARLRLPVHLIGIVPATDNCVDARSVKPGDVIESYAGKTIEVINTDAEGRLILADGLAYMCKHFEPDVLVDLATLTGSAVRALGYHAAALFSANEPLGQSLLEAGRRTGERCWLLPLWDEYAEDMPSDVADLRNMGTRPVAGAIFAAKFLEAFTDDHPAWAHLDIAGVALKQGPFAKDRSATAFGVRLLTDWLHGLAGKNPFRQPA